MKFGERHIVILPFLCYSVLLFFLSFQWFLSGLVLGDARIELNEPWQKVGSLYGGVQSKLFFQNSRHFQKWLPGATSALLAIAILVLFKFCHLKVLMLSHLWKTCSIIHHERYRRVNCFWVIKWHFYKNSIIMYNCLKILTFFTNSKCLIWKYACENIPRVFAMKKLQQL